MTKLALQLLTVILLAALAASPSWADITWNITYEDVDTNTEKGFDDPIEGATRRATLTAVTQYINSVINADGTIDLRINQSLTGGTGSLASAGSFYFAGPNGIQDGLVFEHATTGVDPSVGNVDGTATFDFGYNWNSDLSDPGFFEYDLFSVALHELTHALGFASLIQDDGTSGISGGDPGVFSTFDSFLRVVETVDGDTIISDLVNATGDFIGDVADLTSGNIFFETATGALIEIYAPSTFAPGSSLSHVNLDDSVMSFSIASGEMQRTYSADELAMLSTMGYNVQVAAVPEPSSLLLLAVTGAGIGLCRVRRRRVASETQTAV